jgi:hypothetical protein
LICKHFSKLAPACREMVEARSGELAARLGSSDAEQAAEACEEAAELYQRELG